MRICKGPAIPPHLLEHAAKVRRSDHFERVEAAVVALLDAGAKLQDLEIVTCSRDGVTTTVRLRDGL